MSALEAANITNLEELSRIPENQLANLHGVGPKAIGILKQALNEHKMCLLTPKQMKPKKIEVIDGHTIKYHADDVTRWSKGKVVNGQSDGYWEWYRPDGTLKRSGHFKLGEPIGEWTTYDEKGEDYKVTNR
jgi:hypothetical protein